MKRFFLLKSPGKIRSLIFLIIALVLVTLMAARGSLMAAKTGGAAKSKEVQDLKDEIKKTRAEYEKQKEIAEKLNQGGFWAYMETVKGTGEKTEDKIDQARNKMEFDESQKAAKEKSVKLKQQLEKLETKLKMREA